MTLISVSVEGERALGIKLTAASRGAEKGLTEGLMAASIQLASFITRGLLDGSLGVGHRTGNLARGVFSKMLSPTQAMVFTGKEVPYARFVNDGTRPHVIEARNAQALRFSIGDQVFFRKRVNHPGTKPYHFMETALANDTIEIRRIVEDRVRKDVREAAK